MGNEHILAPQLYIAMDNKTYADFPAIQGYGNTQPILYSSRAIQGCGKQNIF
jgi:hypothetical protein